MKVLTPDILQQQRQEYLDKLIEKLFKVFEHYNSKGHTSCMVTNEVCENFLLEEVSNRLETFGFFIPFVSSNMMIVDWE